MKRTHLYAAALLGLSGCGNPTGNAAGNSVADTGEGMMRPGKYEIDFVREVMEPGQASEPTHDLQIQCFSAEDFRHPELIFVPQDDACTQRDVQDSKGTITARMICTLPNYGPSEFVFDANGTYDSEGAQMIGQSNLGDVTLHETRTFKRQGDC